MRRIGIMLGVVLNLTIAFTANASTDDLAGRSPKSKRTAWMLSLGSTLLPITLGIALTASESERAKIMGGVLLGGGVIIGPGVGQAYADRPVRFAGGAIIRTLCLGIAATGLMFEALYVDGQERGHNALFYAGMGGYTFSAVYDIATVGRSVDAYNRKHAAPEFSVGNFYQSRDRTHGLALTLRF